MKLKMYFLVISLILFFSFACVYAEELNEKKEVDVETSEKEKPEKQEKPDKQHKPEKPEKIEPPSNEIKPETEIPSEKPKIEDKEKITESIKPESAAKDEVGSDFGGVFGAISVDGKTYFMMSILLELTYGKFGLGFDIRLLWNDDGIRDDEWKDWKKILPNTFHHIRYGQKGEEFYAKLGVIDSATLGHGFIMRRYSNLEPSAFARKWGTEFDFFIPGAGLGFESVTNDVTFTRLVGARTYYELLSSPLPIIIGATGVLDRDPAKDKLILQAGNIIDAPSVGETSEYGADLGLQIFKSDDASLLLYGDIAQIKDHGWGYAAPGVSGKIFIFDYLAEYRNFSPNFIPRLFDALYEHRRPINWSDSIYDPNKSRKQGYYAELGMRPISWLYLLGAHERYYNNEDGWSYPYVRLEGTCTAKFIPLFSEVGVGFEQQLDRERNFLTIKSPYSISTLRLGLSLAPGAVLSFTIRQTYDSVYDRYKRTSSMGVQIKF